MMAWLFVVVLIWSALQWRVFWSESFFLPRDNFEVQFPLFQYGIDYLRTFHWPPSWVLGLDGGVWWGPLSNNYLSLLPSRFLGILLGVCGLPANVAYKVSLFVGLVLFLYGIFQVARVLKFTPLESVLVALLAFFSGLGVGPLHQEQALASVIFIPFILLCFHRAYTKPRWWVVAAGLLGYSCNVHYPHLTLLFWFWIGLGFVFSKYKLPSLSWRTGFVSILVFLCQLAPVTQSYFRYKDQLVAPDRGGILEAKNSGELQALNHQTASSVHPKHLLFYLGFVPLEDERLGDLDENGLFAGVGVLWAILFLILRGWAYFFWLWSLVGLSLFSLGSYTPLPSLLSFFPAMNFFRQWYHFSNLLNLVCVFATAVALKEFTVTRFSFRQAILMTAFASIAAVIGLSFEGNPYIWGGTWLLIMAKCVFAVDSKKIQSFLVVWLVLGGMAWSWTATQKVLQYQRWDQLLVQPVVDHFPFPHVGRYGQWKRLVSVKGVEAKSTQELALGGAFYWLTENGSLANVRPDSLKISNGWGRIEVALLRNPLSNRLLFVQAFDEGWKWRNESGDVLETGKGPFGLTTLKISGKRFTLAYVEWGWGILILVLSWVGCGFYFVAGWREDSTQRVANWASTLVRG